MNKTILGAALLFLLIIIGAMGVKLLLPKLEESRQRATSDAVRTKDKIRVAMDNWIGYFILRSPEMKSAMRRAGYNLVCEDDQADYSARMARLKAGEIDLAVATVDSFILNARPLNYPGTIIMVIDESKGGDAILARKDRVDSLDALKGKPAVKIAFTPDSPSHHLLKAAADHFNVPELLPTGEFRIQTDGSEKAREKLLAGKADIAVCWEPDVSRALENDGIFKLLGTEDTHRLIVDILIAGRRFLDKNPAAVKLLLNKYFQVLKKYRDQPDQLFKDVKRETGLSKSAVKSMLKGVEWANFSQNCKKWFGISAPGQLADEELIDTIGSTVRILVNMGDVDGNPLPDDDPYRLTNSSFLEAMFSGGVTGFSAPASGGPGMVAVNSIAAEFPPLTEAGWKTLKEVGTMKVDPIVFQHGASELDHLSKTVIDQAVERLKHYPNFRVIIKGHTGIRGDKKENIRLSQERAEAVARYLDVVYNMDADRIRAVGFGGTKPLDRKPGESKRTWAYRLPRVELVLVQEEY